MEWIIVAMIAISFILGLVVSFLGCSEGVSELKEEHSKRVQKLVAENQGLKDQLDFYRRQENCMR